MRGVAAARAAEEGSSPARALPRVLPRLSRRSSSVKRLAKLDRTGGPSLAASGRTASSDQLAARRDERAALHKRVLTASNAASREAILTAFRNDLLVLQLRLESNQAPGGLAPARPTPQGGPEVPLTRRDSLRRRREAEFVLARVGTLDRVLDRYDASDTGELAVLLAQRLAVMEHLAEMQVDLERKLLAADGEAAPSVLQRRESDSALRWCSASLGAFLSVYDHAATLQQRCASLSAQLAVRKRHSKAPADLDAQRTRLMAEARSKASAATTTARLAEEQLQAALTELLAAQGRISGAEEANAALERRNAALVDQVKALEDRAAESEQEADRLRQQAADAAADAAALERSSALEKAAASHQAIEAATQEQRRLARELHAAQVVASQQSLQQSRLQEQVASAVRRADNLKEALRLKESELQLATETASKLEARLKTQSAKLAEHEQQAAANAQAQAAKVAALARECAALQSAREGDAKAAATLEARLRHLEVEKTQALELVQAERRGLVKERAALHDEAAERVTVALRQKSRAERRASELEEQLSQALTSLGALEAQLAAQATAPTMHAPLGRAETVPGRGAADFEAVLRAEMELMQRTFEQRLTAATQENAKQARRFREDKQRLAEEAERAQASAALTVRRLEAELEATRAERGK